MTRAEALKKYNSVLAAAGFPASETIWVDVFVALGMLKLDEPKSAIDKLFWHGDGSASWRSKASFQRALDELNLKIVEK